MWAREAGAPHKLERVCVLLKTAGKLKGVEEGLMKVVEAVFAKPEEMYMHASLMCRSGALLTRFHLNSDPHVLLKFQKSRNAG